MFNVLFLCTGNSARSIMAEALLNHAAPEKFKAYSAGSHPNGQVKASALKVLQTAKVSTKGLRSKNWEEFAGDDAPKMDFVITVCDKVKNEVCPVWPGQPMTAHWGLEAVSADNEDLKPYSDMLRCLVMRIGLFTQLPIEKLDRLKIQHEVDEIGKMTLAP